MAPGCGSSLEGVANCGPPAWISKGWGGGGGSSMGWGGGGGGGASRWRQHGHQGVGVGGNLWPACLAQQGSWGAARPSTPLAAGGRAPARRWQQRAGRQHATGSRGQGTGGRAGQGSRTSQVTRPLLWCLQAEQLMLDQLMQRQQQVTGRLLTCLQAAARASSCRIRPFHIRSRRDRLPGGHGWHCAAGEGAPGRGPWPPTPGPPQP